MKNKTLFTTAAALVLLVGAAHADQPTSGFTGPYAPGTWTHSGPGSSVFSGGGQTVTITGGDIGVPSNTDLTHISVTSGAWSFNWDYSSLNSSSGFDNGYYLLNGIPVFLATAAAGDPPVTGSVCVPVSAGDTIGWRVESTDGIFGPGVLIIDRFEFSAACDPCATDEVILNTGYDHLSGGVLPISSIDPRWIVVSDPQTTTSEPRPATVIVGHPAWEPPEPGSQWISGYPSSAQTDNGAYIFQTPFCLREGIDLTMASLELGMRGDDACFAYLNEDVADILSGAATPFHIGNPFSSPVLTVGTYSLASLGAAQGKNLLQIRVQNIGSVAMGLNLVASVFASPSGTADDPACCNNFGALQGRKFDDVDGDGVRDLGEPGLPGWQINVSGSGTGFSASVLTDSNGFYNFTTLAPDTYTITETAQPGWQQTYPATGSHVVTLVGIQGVNGLDFGNQLAPCLNVSNEKILCPLEDTTPPCYTYSFNITNKSGLTVQYVGAGLHPTTPSGTLIPSININPNQINLLAQDGSLLDDGETTSITLTICGGNPGDDICIELSLVTPKPEFLECCFQDVCIELPECDCGQLSRQEFSDIICDPRGEVSFTFSFNLENLSTFAADQVTFGPATGEQGTFVKDFFYLPPLAPGGSLPMSVQIVGAAPGEEFCFSVLLQHPSTGEDCCCGFIKCITAPACPDELLGCCQLPGLVCSTTTEAECDGIWTPTASCFTGGGTGFCVLNPMPLTCQGDLNLDGQISGLDLALLLAQWTGTSSYQPCPPNATADCNQDCHIDGLDLGMMLGAWGSCK